MVDIHRLPGMEDVEREAGQWIARLNADDVTNEDRARFEEWRRADARHARAYDEILVTWQRFNEAGRLVRAVARGRALGAPAPAARTKRRIFISAAASLALAALAGWWWVSELAPRTLFQTAVGENATVRLPDGSSVELNSNSLVRVDYRATERIIRLERGEAFFEVEHDPSRPFWVVAGSSWVGAVGTAFNVYVLPTGVRVVVGEGTVKVAARVASNSETPSDLQLARASVALLKAGEQVEVQGAATQVRSLAPVEMKRSVSWRTGTVNFEREPLARVVAELSRYTTLHVILEDDALGELQVGGSFQTSPRGTEALLTTLQDGFGLQVVRDGRTVRVTSGNPQ